MKSKLILSIGLAILLLRHNLGYSQNSRGTRIVHSSFGLYGDPIVSRTYDNPQKKFGVFIVTHDTCL